MKIAESCSIDTNVLLRLLVRDIEDQYKRAESLLTQANKIIVEDSVFTEAVYILIKGYGISRENIAELLLNFIKYKNVSCASDAISGALYIFVSRPSLSFIDCLLAYQSEMNGAGPLYTFDKKLANQHPSARLL